MNKDYLKKNQKHLNYECYQVINEITFDGFYEYVQHCTSLNDVKNYGKKLYRDILKGVIL